MTIVLLIVALAIFFPGLSEISAWGAWGGFISEDRLDAFLGRYLHLYELNEFDRERELLGARLPAKENDFFGTPLPYLSKCKGSMFATWYLQDTGRIPRWSRWSKKLDAYREELIKKTPSRIEKFL